MDFRLLGEPQVWHDGRRIDLGGRRRQCVLAVLLLHPGQLVSIEKIIACAWPEDPPPTAARLVASYVARLRRILEPAGGIRFESREGGHLAAVDPDLIDTHRFSLLIHQAYTGRADAGPEVAAGHLRSALALCHGNPLAGLDSRWLRERGRALEAIRLDALEELARLDLARGRPRDVIALLREPHAAHPEREGLAELLVRALHAADDPARAAQTAEGAIRAVRELGLEPGPRLRRAQHDTLTDRTGPAAATVPGPRHRLPAASLAFAGRTGELTFLTDLAAAAHRDPPAESAVVCAVHGAGGVGKTAVVLRAAHRVAGDFPDGRLFLDLRGHTPGLEPLTALEALDWLLRSLGIAPALIPQDLDRCAAFYRDRLAGTRTLIVLDNAANAAQIRPLLPGAGECLTLITSRRQLIGLDDTSMRTLSLDVLPPGDAVALLRTVAGAARVPSDDPNVAEIAALCGYLPLAIRIAAARLRHQSSLTTGDLAAALRTEYEGLSVSGLDGGERSVAAVFDLVCSDLSAAERNLLRRVGLIPGPDFDAFAAANLIETDYDITGSLLESLVARNLLLQPSPGRYRPHDLVRDRDCDRIRSSGSAEFVDDQDAAEGQAAVARLFDYYQYTAGHADARIARHDRPEPAGRQPTYAPYLSEPDQARTWLRTERANLMACIDKAVAEGWDERVVGLTGGLATTLRADGPWPLASAMHTTALAAARRLGDRQAQAGALVELGAVRRLTGDLPGAARDLEAALEPCQDLGDRRTRASALIELGAVRLRSGEYPEATQDLEEALDLSRQLGDRRTRAHCLTRLGAGRELAGDLAAALRDLEEALDLWRGLGHLAGQADTLTRLGTVRRLTGDYSGATKDFEEALSLRRESGDRRGESRLLRHLGDVRLRSGDYAGAKRDYEEALEIARGLGYLNGQAVALGGLGIVRRLAGDLSGAVAIMGQGLEILYRIGAQANVPRALNHYGAIFVDYGDLSRAMAVYREALRLAREFRRPDDEAHALEGMGGCFLADGAVDEGVSHLTAASGIYRRLGMRPDRERVETVLAKPGSN